MFWDQGLGGEMNTVLEEGLGKRRCLGLWVYESVKLSPPGSCILGLAFSPGSRGGGWEQRGSVMMMSILHWHKTKWTFLEAFDIRKAHLFGVDFVWSLLEWGMGDWWWGMGRKGHQGYQNKFTSHTGIICLLICWNLDGSHLVAVSPGFLELPQGTCLLYTSDAADE